MKEKLFKLILNSLQPQTLAYLARDLNNSLEDWQYYPEDAPPEPIRQQLRQTLEMIMVVGVERSEAEGLDFTQLVEQTTVEQDQDDWRQLRNQQMQQNWLSDLQ